MVNALHITDSRGQRRTVGDVSPQLVGHVRITKPPSMSAMPPCTSTVATTRARPAPLRATSCWVVERTHAWHNAFKKLAWCTERRGLVIRFYLALANAIIIVRRLVREAWKRYRWDTRPKRCP
jgi:hypothetical protein